MSAYVIAGAFPVVETCSMKLRRFAILSSVFVCFGTSGPAFAATLVVDDDFLDCPQAEFNSIQAAVLVAQRGDKILVCPGTYAESVLINESELRIEAQAAPGVVVLQGTRAQPFGFHLLNTTGVLLQGFMVQGFGRGNIRIEGSTDPLEGISSGNTLRKNVTTDAGTDGIQVVNSSANVVEQNISFNNLGALSDGIFVCGVPPIDPMAACTPSGAASSGNIIRHNQTSGNRIGIHLNGTGPDNVVFRNETFDNRMAGIRLFRSGQAEPGGTGNVVFRNDSYRNGTAGIQNMAMSPGNVIENNQVFANNQGGIFIGNSTGVTARNNRSENNIGFGIRLQNGAANNLVEKNEVFQNTQDGIQLESNVDGNTIQLNLVRENVRDGIRVVDLLSNGNTFERNVIRESGEHDAHDNGTANVWINNKCETSEPPGLCEHPGH